MWLNLHHNFLCFNKAILSDKPNQTINIFTQDLPAIPCLPQQLGQVFVNLFVNAAQAIDTQGVISIVTTQEKPWVVVKICDTGSGISPAAIKRVFEPFFTTKVDGKGTGLGLSICHDIIQKHHGTIEVESKEGEGTCFTIKLPLAGVEIEEIA